MKLNELNKYYTFHLTSYIDVGELERDTVTESYSYLFIIFHSVLLLPPDG